MVRTRPVTCVTLLAVGTLLATLGPLATSPALASPTGGAPVPAALPGAAPAADSLEASAAAAAAQASALDLRIAGLATRTTAAQASALDADLTESRLEDAFDQARATAGALLAEAYVDDAPDSAQAVPGPYLDAARRVTYGVLDKYRAALVRIHSDQAGARDRLATLEALQAQLADQRQSLAAIVGADQAALARRASADAAALARSDAARQTATTRLAPISLAATQAQQSLMARYPFGPVSPSGPGPGMRASGPAITGTASWYGPGFDGQPTATGAVYDESGWTVASPDLALGTFLLVSGGGRSVLLLVNDRGPYVAGRILDLSHAAAEALGSDGLMQVSAQVVVPVDSSTAAP